MAHINHIESAPDPRKKNGAADKDVVDPEKFQKALRVEKSEETDQWRGKNRAKRPEEHEEEDDVGAQIPVPPGLFKNYMTEDEKGNTVLDVQGGSAPTLKSDGSESSASAPSYSFVHDNEGKTSNVNVGVSDNASDEASSLESNDIPDIDNTTEPLYPNLPEDAEIHVPNEKETESDNINSEKTPEKEKTKETEKAKEQKKTEGSDKKKETDKSKEKKTTVVVQKSKKKKSQAPEKETEKAKVAEEKKPTKDKEEKTSKSVDSQKGKIEQEPKSKHEAKEKTETQTSLAHDTKDKQDSKDEKEGKGADEMMVGQVAASNAAPSIEPPPLSPFANMPKDVFELFERMVGMMQIQKDQGKTEITVTLSMKGSAFDGCKIVLEHFSTAPHAYNVQFLGNPEGVEKFAKNMQGLNNAIGESKLNFSINLLPPKLTKNYAGRVEKPDSSKDQQEKDREEKQ